MNIMKNLSCIATFIAMSQLCAAQTDVTLAHWSFNNTYSVSGDVATPTKTAATNSTNLHGLKLRPNTQAGSSDTWLMPWRPTRSGQVAAQDDKGAYLEQGAISCDGCALHLTSPVPTPKMPPHPTPGATRLRLSPTAPPIPIRNPTTISKFRPQPSATRIYASRSTPRATTARRSITPWHILLTATTGLSQATAISQVPPTRPGS